MGLFSKKPKEIVEDMTTASKFNIEKRNQAAMFILRIYRANKIKIPETIHSKVILKLCDEIDPEHKMSERELVDKLFQSKDAADAISKAIENDVLVPDEVIKSYADNYYNSLRELIVSPESGAFDAYEYQSQQLISILSVKKMDVFRSYLKDRMDSDPTCPFFIKKSFFDLLQAPKSLPTQADEEIAEHIIKLTSPHLNKTNPEVFRALVDSLKWRGTEDLNRTLENVKKTPPENRHIRGRESCIFIEADETVHYIG